MFGSVVLEISIALIFFYILTSLLASTLLETIAGLFSLRAKNLESALVRLLNKPKTDASSAPPNQTAEQDIIKETLAHPLIQSITKPDGWLKKNRKPSYIPKDLFVTALLDVLPKEDGGKELSSIRDKVNLIENNKIRKLLGSLVDDAGDNVVAVRARLENWYDQVMDRASGWYKRQAQIIILIITSVLVISYNLDSIMLAKYLWKDKTARQVVVAMAENTQLDSNNSQALLLQESNLLLKQIDLPICFLWMLNDNYACASTTESNEKQFTTKFTVVNWSLKVLGLLITIFAVSLGAPFWFDL
ncbi:MAG: hypothetical protein OEZ58_23340, partial [Gammaproteobacteria bacterium]|nr:hypothetical protein [Gammaproteobacteria bacterium]